MNAISQKPGPGSRQVMFRGDTITFTLSLPGPVSEQMTGQARLRTNIGRADVIRGTIIDQVDKGLPPLGTEWFDLPMRQIDDRQFQITLPLLEVGHFEAKAHFIPTGQTRPIWPAGPNTIINVEPAQTCCANIIYNAFVRQFGPNQSGAFRPSPQETDAIKQLDEKGFAVIPPSGTFRDLIGALDFIIGALGCRLIQLLPIHPTPTTYGRMGRFGSPYAALDFIGVDPALAVFDPTATPLEQFAELVDAIHARHARLILDIAVNHTGWAARLHESHPHWLKRDEKGEIQVPGAWGVQWSDLTSLDYSRQDLWQYIADVFLTWCRRGVDGFRCDAGYMIPVRAWRYIVAVVRDQFPDTIFLLEGLGGKISVTRDILNRANLNWAYSELFQNYDRGQIEYYLPEADEISRQEGPTIHFAETHDNNRLAARSHAYARMRTALCALLSHQGGFGFANGVEWLATEKIDVHDASSLNWGAKENLIDHIRRLNILLRHHPAFFPQTRQTFVQQGQGNFLALLRHHRPSGKELLILINLDDRQSTRAFWKLPTHPEPFEYTDLLTGTPLLPDKVGDGFACDLSPGQVVCLTADADDLSLIETTPASLACLPARDVSQRIRAKALEVWSYYFGVADLGGIDPETLGRQMAGDPVEFCRQLNNQSDESRVIVWQWPRDARRQVMIPPGHFLLIMAESSFHAGIIDDDFDQNTEDDRIIAREEALPLDDGRFFALFTPVTTPAVTTARTLRLTVFEPGTHHHRDASLLFLKNPDPLSVKTIFQRPDLMRDPRLVLSTNKRGGMMRAYGWWGHLGSKYDALLAANLNPDYPEDRWIMLTRCRGWVVFQGYYQEICLDCLDTFEITANGGIWHHRVPTGQGQYIDLAITVDMASDENTIHLEFHRAARTDSPKQLANDAAVDLILRPDIDDRNFHQTTKAYTGPEQDWPNRMQTAPDAFVFSPAPARRLRVVLPGSRFVREPEWHYMIPLPHDAERGMDATTDLFSPGYFSINLSGGQTVRLTAGVNESGSTPELARANATQSPPLNDDQASSETVLIRNLSQYVVRRGDLQSVIAGYPWFLDWGRDSLIFSRGLIAAGQLDEAKAVLTQFARFEKDGTLPNMICGHDAGNRDTSDAPLWLFTACADIMAAEQALSFADAVCGDRTIREILLSIARSYIKGTPNGIAMDRDSGLIFSPIHFTWMDTNFPAGTPRQGYCIEIQALWQAALTLLTVIDTDNSNDWESLAVTVRQSIQQLFPIPAGYLADCMHAAPGEKAAQATPDDALRPNQLLAITLGAVTDTTLATSVLDACQCLLVPGAIRSLADQPVDYPIAVNHNGKTLNDPAHPYWGCYCGDEDTRRKPAYHNGTAWTWPFPLFCEAWASVYGEAGKPAARAWLSSSLMLFNRGCIGHLPEIVDGDYPHKSRGCDAQAWGLSEFIRVWRKLK